MYVPALALYLVIAEAAIDPVIAVASFDEIVIGAVGNRPAGDRFDNRVNVSDAVNELSLAVI